MHCSDFSTLTDGCSVWEDIHTNCLQTLKIKWHDFSLASSELLRWTAKWAMIFFQKLRELYKVGTSQGWSNLFFTMYSQAAWNIRLLSCRQSSLLQGYTSAYHRGDITPASSSEAFLFSLSKYVLVSTASMVWLGLIRWLLYSFIGWPLALELAFV